MIAPLPCICLGPSDGECRSCALNLGRCTCENCEPPPTCEACGASPATWTAGGGAEAEQFICDDCRGQDAAVAARHPEMDLPHWTLIADRPEPSGDVLSASPVTRTSESALNRDEHRVSR